VLEVEDTGTGIPKLIRDQIFLPFFTTKPVGKGTGQGLAIVHSVAAKHGGTVTFESEEGKGTTFTVKLPISAQD
jgi:signal transduction histidine kinase